MNDYFEDENIIKREAEKEKQKKRNRKRETEKELYIGLRDGYLIAPLYPFVLTKLTTIINIR